MALKYLTPNDDAREVATKLRQAFTFFRKHGDGKYSANTIMSLLRASEGISAAIENGGVVHANHLPSLAVAEMPYSFDEETEVKSGGLMGIAIHLPDNRILIAVHSEARRKRLGTVLLHILRAWRPAGEMSIWVHRSNDVAQHFLLSNECVPWVLNPSGAIQWVSQRGQYDTSGAAENCNDWEIEEAIRMNAQYHQTRDTAPVEAPLLDRLALADDSVEF